MESEFSTRSRFVQPLFFGDRSEIETGDLVEVWLDNIHVRIRLDTVDGETLKGTVTAMAEDARTFEKHAGLTVGDGVKLRQEHIRACWKPAAA